MSDIVDRFIAVGATAAYGNALDRIAELERELESARSLAVDRDQRLARIAAFLDPGEETDCGCDECIAWRIATGEDKP